MVIPHGVGRQHLGQGDRTLGRMRQGNTIQKLVLGKGEKMPLNA